MTDHDDDSRGASPEEMRAALRGWVYVTGLVVAILGVSWLVVEM